MTIYLRTAIEEAAVADASAAAELLQDGDPTSTVGTADGVAASLERAIESYRSDPTGTACAAGPQPGAEALVGELGRRFGGRAEIFACRPVRGATRLSLHAEGRAVDWFRRATDPVEAAEAQRIIDWLMAPDAQGNQHALARRMGIQEIIWNRRIWTARRQAEGWRVYTGVNPHTDHLHIGLNWPGARMQTSFWQPQSGPGSPSPAVPVKPPAPAPTAPPQATVEIDPQPADYADLATEILRKNKTKASIGVVLSVVRLMPRDGRPLIDGETVKGKQRPVLKNPPNHLVQPPEVYEITWRRGKRGEKKLRYVWILSTEKATFPVGGIMFLPLGIECFLVTFNTGILDSKICTNVHHAEMQAANTRPHPGFITAQPTQEQARISSIDIWNLSRKRGLGYSPCNPCCVDLATFLTNHKALSPGAPVSASITWLTRYDRNAACGHPTDEVNLKRLERSGWTLHRPKMSGQPLPPTPSLGAWTA